MSTEFDFQLCVEGGQTFRWLNPRDSLWVGVDGNRWYVVENGNMIRTNASNAAFRELFDLDRPWSQVHNDICLLGPEIEPLIRKYGGVRVLKQSNPVETLFTFLCTANNHLGRIGPMVRHLASFGERIGEVEDIELTAFPTVDVLAELNPGGLREKGFGYRSETILACARELKRRGGDDYVATLKSCDYLSAIEQLKSLPFIGQKLADCISLFGLHHSIAVPVDTHIWQMAVRYYFHDWAAMTATEKRKAIVAEFFRERFGQHAGYVQQLMFCDNMLNWRHRKRTEVS